MSDTFKMKPTRSKTIWQYSWRGGIEWVDCDSKEHAEIMRGRSAIVREIIILQTITSCEDPPVTVFSNERSI